MGLKRLLWLPVAMSLAGCWAHSFPDRTAVFVAPPSADLATVREISVFADPNGTLYPTGWAAHVPPRRSWKADSLLNAAVSDSALGELIARDEPRQFADAATFARSRRRIFVLVHGYNNTVEEADPAFDAIVQKLSPRRDDGVVRFYWDGLTGQGVGGGKIWFNAVGNSQLVGSRALRRLLQQFEGKSVYLIGHSRGASVILSALGNPVYDSSFRARTRSVAAHFRPPVTDIVSPPPLDPRGNSFHILLLAPAVDRIDFCDERYQQSARGRFACPALRPLGAAVRSLRYTVNPADPVLNKFIGASGGFNPTGLGLRKTVGEGIAASGGYQMMQAYPFATPMKAHGFAAYVAHPTFDAMLADEGLLAPRSP